jgi:prophage regulatory protein
MGPRILRLPDVKTRTGLSRSSIYKFVSAGMFPAPIRIGTRAIGWLDDEVEAWMLARIHSSRARAANRAGDDAGPTVSTRRARERPRRIRIAEHGTKSNNSTVGPMDPSRD